MEFVHQPVLVDEVLKYLAPRLGEIYVDATLGLGGHAEKILEVAGPMARLVGIEWDEEALECARKRLARYEAQTELVCANFAEFGSLLDKLGIPGVDGVIFDLGLSSFQLESARGFSFNRDAPLDMRMSRMIPKPAAALVQGLGERDLAQLLKERGEERWARPIARAMVRARKEGRKLTRTLELAELVGKIVRGRGRLHPATRVFQALRIAVNGELENLEKVMATFDRYLRRGGRVVVISFHSLEDRIVKQAFRERAKAGVLHLLTRKPVIPTRKEVAENPRARSAKLRAAVKIV